MNIEQITASLEAVDAQGPIDLRVNRADLICVVAALQLACRHPRYEGPSREIVIHFANEVIKTLPGEWQSWFSKGWNSSLDTIIRSE